MNSLRDTMNLNAFRQTLSQAEPPPALSLALQALWWDAKGDWHRAHACAQQQDDADGAWVHAYLHRKEGDMSNASYWYRRARKPVFQGDLEAEWEYIATALLAQGSEA